MDLLRDKDEMPIEFDRNYRINNTPSQVPEQWQGELTNAYNALPLLVNTCINRLGIAGPLYWKWFGNPGPNGERWQFVKRVFQTLAQWHQTKTIRFANVTGHGARVPDYYVWQLPDGGHVGNGIRILITETIICSHNPQDIAGLIAHEMIHKLGMACGRNIIDQGPDPYYRGPCLLKAQTDPNIAVTNADNYRLFLKEANRVPWGIFDG